ncbi:MAG: BTAD domain-containing putative transcriptional regulator [Caldilineaceae bacterium]
MELDLSFLGAFQAQLNNQPVTAFESNKARALLAYLAIEAAQPWPRAQLAGLFWPEIREVNARDNLRHALANLRAILHDRQRSSPFLLVTRQSIQFNIQSLYRLDVAEFVDGIAPNRAMTTLEDAVKLYSGPLLDGFFLDGCSAFEEWLLLTRERLHRQMIDALYKLGEHFAAQGDFVKAERYARRLLELDNLQEEAHCQLMRILARRGQRSAALQQYEQCRQLLAAALGAPPSVATVTLHQQIQRGLWGGDQPVTLWPLPVAKPAAPESARQNLPAVTTSFVGRRHEIQLIGAFLRRPELRLLTLHGPGGVGKTRLALQAARALCADFADGCCWVELAPLHAPPQVVTSIAQSLGVAENAGHEPLQTVQAHLRHKTLLLVLDNYEHLLDAAPVVDALLKSCERLKCLVTSREPLRLYGEQELMVEPLPLSTPQQSMNVAELAALDAVQLFQQRAHSVQPHLHFDAALIPVVAEICTRLDGMPLAIELAAARTRQFTPPQLLARLTAEGVLSPSLLRNQVRNAAGRHQTLQSAIAWSYRLLDDQEQQLFRKLSIFSGGCTLAAITALCTPAKHEDVSELLWRLVDKNLVRIVDAPIGKRSRRALPARFEMLETIRAFGLARLPEHDELSAAQHACAAYYLALTEELNQLLPGGQGSYAADQLDFETPNVSAVLQYAIDAPHLELGLSLCSVLWKYWSEQGFLATGRQWVLQMVALAQSASPTPAYASALFTAATWLFRQGESTRARVAYAECLRLAEVFQDEVQVGFAQALLAVVTFCQGDYAASAQYSAAGLALWRKLDRGWNIGLILANMGHRATRLGDFPLAKQLLTEALAVSQQAQHNLGVAMSFHWLGQLAVTEGLVAEAHASLAKAWDLSQSDDFRPTKLAVMCEQAALCLLEGDPAAARLQLQDALRLCSALEQRSILPAIGDHLLHLYMVERNFAHALTVAASAGQLYESMSVVRTPHEQAQIDSHIAAARAHLSPATAAAAWAAGRALPLHNVDHVWFAMLTDAVGT